MASSERATSSLLAVPLSTEGRLVATARAGRPAALPSPSRRSRTLAAMALSWPAGRLARRGWASQEPPSTVSGPANAQGGTASGPYVVKPVRVLEPPAPTSFSPQ